MIDFQIILLMVLFSALFSGLEIAFLSSNRIRLELFIKQRGMVASLLRYFYDHPEQFISTMLVGNNIALVVYGLKMAQVLHPLLEGWIYPEPLLVLVQSILSTLVILVTAEFIPKTIFKLNPNFWMEFLAFPIFPIFWLLYPVAIVSMWLSKGILRLFGMKVSKRSHERVFSKTDLDYFIQQSIDDSLDNSEVDTEVKIFQNALDFSKTKVRDCMVPRIQVESVDWNTTRAELIERFTTTGYSKILVYREDIDDVVGYIHSSELFIRTDDWRTGITEILFVPETLAANQLMKQLMSQHKTIAAVLDEFGGFAGIVAMEDIIEEIFGEIEDEHDMSSDVCKPVGENSYLISAKLEIDLINERLNLDLPEDNDYATLAGYILHHIQRVPAYKETFTIAPYTITLMKGSRSKIDLVQLTVAKS